MWNSDHHHHHHHRHHHHSAHNDNPPSEEARGYEPSYRSPPGPTSSGFYPPLGPPGGYGYVPPPGPPYGQYAPPPGPPPDRGTYPGQQYYDGVGYPAQQYPPPRNYDRDQMSSAPTRPPTEPQTFGLPGGRDSQPYFHYSQCTGKKKALCIGINYIGQNSELHGCINDANNIATFLCHHYGYEREDIVMLTDDASDPRQLPTKQNIFDGMRWLVRHAAPDDSLFFHYSGHGGLTKDLRGDEIDGYAEVIYPVDFEENGHIVDDEMYETMVRPLPPGCRLTAIYDSCHSGSVLDLPYMYSHEGKIKEPNIGMMAGEDLFSAASAYARGDTMGIFESAKGLARIAMGQVSRAQQITRATRTSPADAISWSGCKDSQTSADANEGGHATGAMSWAFMTVLRQDPNVSYLQLLINIRALLGSRGYKQKPQLSSSHPMDTNILFIC